MQVQPVNINSIYQVWDDVAPYIEAAFKSPGADCTVDQAKVYLVKGLWQLVVFVDNDSIKGAAVVEYINRANDRVAFIIAVGGRLIADRSGFEGLKSVVRSNGATKFEGAARESVARLWKIKFGVVEKYRIVEVSL